MSRSVLAVTMETGVKEMVSGEIIIELLINYFSRTFDSGDSMATGL